MLNGYLVALAVVLAWTGLVYYLSKSKWMERHNMAFYVPPIVMWRTQRGRSLVDRLATKPRFWNGYARVSVWICAILMVSGVALLAYEATLVPLVKQAPSPRLILAIPGINPIIPVGYGILALAVTLIVHEFAHGILTRVGKMRLLSIGLLLFVFPIGAFVEPDDNELRKTTVERRVRVYAAGPGTNIVVAAIAFVILAGVMIPSLAPAHEGALAVGVVDGGPAMMAGIRASCVVVSVDGRSVTNTSDIESRVSSNPGAPIDIDYYYRGQLHTARNVTDGLVVSFVASGFAASKAGLAVGDVILSLNDTPVGNLNVLTDLMSRAHSGQSVNISVMRYNSASRTFTVDTVISSIEFSDKYEYYRTYDPAANSLLYRGVGFLGAGFLDLGLDFRNVTYYAQLISQPFAGDRNLDDVARSFLVIMVLPFAFPVTSTQVTGLYHPAGLLAWVPDSGFWLVAGSLYWIFWLNFLVGLFNVLPVPILDGGAIFKDFARILINIRGDRYTNEKKEAILAAVTRGVYIVVSGLLILLLIGPYISAALQQ